MRDDVKAYMRYYNLEQFDTANGELPAIDLAGFDEDQLNGKCSNDNVFMLEDTYKKSGTANASF